MAWRKGRGEQAQVQQVELQPGETVVSESIVEEPSGETHIHRTVREWHPHAPERLAEIESVIDSWGRRSSDSVPAARLLSPDELQARVDKVTKRVKGSRKVVVKETVTDWVERPVEPEPEPEDEASYTPVQPVVEAAPLKQVVIADEEETVKVSRPKGAKKSFRILGFLGKRSEKVTKPAKPKKAKGDKGSRDESDPEYQPQCAALTEDGEQCRNSARGVSRYCSSHKGYQPPTAKGLAQRIEGDSWDPEDDVTDRESVRGADTRPVVRKAKDTKVKVRKAAKKSSKKAGPKKR